MNIDDLYREIIQEGISSVLFHHTDFINLLSILKTNKFKLSGASDSSQDAYLSKGRKYYFSTSRTRTASYRWHSLNRSSGIDAFITLDGRSLGARYKGEAVDFFGGMGDGPRKSIPYEQEDRIYTNDKEIPNAVSYITKIEIFSKKKIVPTEDQIDLLITRTGGRIPIYFYKDESSFISGNHMKALDLRLLKEETITEASISTRRWIAENVPENYKRPMLAVVNIMSKSGLQLTLTHSEAQLRTIAKLYNVDFVTLTNFVKKMSMFLM